MDPLPWQNNSLVLLLNCNIFIPLRQWGSGKLLWVSIKIALLTYRRCSVSLSSSPFIGRSAKQVGQVTGWSGRPLAILGSYVPVPGASGPCSPSDAISKSPNRTRNASVERIAGYLSKGLLPAVRQAYRRGETPAPSALKKEGTKYRFKQSVIDSPYTVETHQSGRRRMSL